MMAGVYARLEGFPQPEEQPAYYQLLKNVGSFLQKPDTEIFAAYAEGGGLLGAVVFFGDMQYYASGGSAAKEKRAAGFRLLAVSEQARGRGVGKALTLKCIDRARELELPQLIIHSTQAMQTAWSMYEKLGFERSPDLDFTQAELPVFGFRLRL